MHIRSRQLQLWKMRGDSEFSPDRSGKKDVQGSDGLSEKTDPAVFFLQAYLFSVAEKVIRYHCAHTISHIRTFLLRPDKDQSLRAWGPGSGKPSS